MAGSGLRFTRRAVLFSGISGFGAARLAAAGSRGATFPSDWRRYADPTTDLEVYRLTGPAYTSTLPAPYNRPIAPNGASLLFCSDRAGSPQAFLMDLKNGGTRQLTDAAGLDGRSLALLTDTGSFCYFAERSLRVSNLLTLRERDVYLVPEGWERAAGIGLEPDGSHALLVETRGGGSRLRAAPLRRGSARTVLEAPFVSEPVARPGRAQILYRQDDRALWLVNSDGKRNRRLETAPGRVGAAHWSGDGKTILYLSFPDDPAQLNAIRELDPDAGTDKLVARTSQFAAFGANRDGTVFVGASRNAASPTILLLVRSVRRELTLCEHRASRPETVAPMFSPDSQRIYFQSDRHGKPALYSMHVERLVERTGSL
jgi:oligogalacturonide lyase